MDWDKLLSTKRLGMEEINVHDQVNDRPQFQRDYDRIIFSPPFRRMQNKTQVFPLPGQVFVHNRLTHSLEVASVGRSLGKLLSDYLIRNNITVKHDLLSEIGTVVSAACLAHDMGNPPFGHSGESAISDFFNSDTGREFLIDMTDGEKKDFLQFDGNANAFRLLSHQFKGKRTGGFALTYTTLASIIKYPYESALTSKPKFGFFNSEKATYSKIAGELGISVETHGGLKGKRHPLVLFTEAADDICYQIMDLEDACKLGILGYHEVKDMYLAFYDSGSDKKAVESIHKTFQQVTDPNEQISYLRAGLIGKLILLNFNIFIKNYEEIMDGSFNKSLTGCLEGVPGEALQHVKKVSVSKVYNHRSVVEIEIAGYKIIGTLLEEFTGSVLHPDSGYSRRILSLLPDQYKTDNDSAYHKVQSVVDFISGMTDNFALELYRKIKGINLPEIG